MRSVVPVLLLPPGLVDTRHEYERVFAIYVPIAIGVFVLIVLALAFAVLRYRRRPLAAAARWHEHNRIEGGYALLLALVVAFLLYLTFSAEHRVDTVAAHERSSLTIDVTGAKWEWELRHADMVFTVHAASAKQFTTTFTSPTSRQIHFWRVGIWIVPVLVFFAVRGACRSLQRSGRHPLRAWDCDVVRRRQDGAIEIVADSPDRILSVPSEPPVGTVPGHEIPR